MLSTKSLVWTAVLAFSLITAATSAQGASATLDGVYTLDTNASDNVDKAIDVAIANMGFVKRSFARGIFKKRHPAYAQIRISHDGNEVVLTLAAGNPMRMPIDGSIAKWKREDGEVLEIKGQWKITGLVQTIDTFADDTNVKDTQRVNNFSLDAGGSLLTLSVRFTADGLDQPISYQLVYQRNETK